MGIPPSQGGVRLKKLTIFLFVLIAVIVLAFFRFQYNQDIARTAAAAKMEYAEQKKLQEQKEKEATEFWKKKNWYVIGDSLTVDSQYPSIVAQKVGLTNVTTDAQPHRTFSELDDELDEEKLKAADLITIFAGTHDYGGNTPLGSIEDQDTTPTFYGQAQALIGKIHSLKKPEATVVMITPTIRGSLIDNEQSPQYPSPNLNGHVLEDYVEALIDVNYQNEFELINLFSESGITLENLEEYTSDNLRFNDKGDELVAEIIANKLLKF